VIFISYDAAYGYELFSHIIRTELDDPWGLNADVMYCTVVQRADGTQPAEPEDLDVDGLLKGIYRLRRSAVQGPKAQLLSPPVRRAVGPQGWQLLAEDWVFRRLVRDILDRTAPTVSPPRNRTSSTPTPERSACRT
jgi:pyruvate dehydrogenase E1 component